VQDEYITSRAKKLNGSRDHKHTPFGSDVFIYLVWFYIAYLRTKFEISTFTQYKDKKGDNNAKIWVVWGG